MATSKTVDLLGQGLKPGIATSIGCSCNIITCLPSEIGANTPEIWDAFLAIIKQPTPSYGFHAASLCVTAENYNSPKCNIALAAEGWEHIATISSSHNSDSFGTPKPVLLWIKHHPNRARLPHKSLTPTGKP